MLKLSDKTLYVRYFYTNVCEEQKENDFKSFGYYFLEIKPTNKKEILFERPTNVTHQRLKAKSLDNMTYNSYCCTYYKMFDLEPKYYICENKDKLENFLDKIKNQEGTIIEEAHDNSNIYNFILNTTSKITTNKLYLEKILLLIENISYQIFQCISFSNKYIYQFKEKDINESLLKSVCDEIKDNFNDLLFYQYDKNVSTSTILNQLFPFEYIEPNYNLDVLSYEYNRNKYKNHKKSLSNYDYELLSKFNKLTKSYKILMVKMSNANYVFSRDGFLTSICKGIIKSEIDIQKRLNKPALQINYIEKVLEDRLDLDIVLTRTIAFLEDTLVNYGDNKNRVLVTRNKPIIDNLVQQQKYLKKSKRGK